MKKNTMVWLFTFAVMLTLTSVGRADTITIGAQLNGGAITVLYSGSSPGSFLGSFDGYTINASGLGTPPNNQPTIQTNNIDVTSNVAGNNVLKVYITENNITYPVGSGNQFFSSFTSNDFTCNSPCTGTSGISLGEATFVDASNGLYNVGATNLAGTAVALASHTFSDANTADGNGLGTFGQLNNVPALGNPSDFSLSAVYTVTTDNNQESVNGTINVPEPGTIFLFGGGLFGVAGLLRRKILS